MRRSHGSAVGDGGSRVVLRKGEMCGMTFVLGTFLTACPSSPERSSGPDSVENTASASRELVSRSERVMGSLVTLTAYAPDAEKAVQAFGAAFQEFHRLEALLTVWRADSDVTRINRAAGKARVSVAPETFEVIQRAIEMSRMTGGKFDVTFGALSGLWRFDHDQDNRIPSQDAIQERLPLVGWEQIEMDAATHSVRLGRKGARIHLGGIGKGYAVDRAVAILRECGLVDFMVQAGGDLYVAGRKGDRAWRVGVRDPRGGPETYFAAAEIEDATFSTSGDYERFFIRDGRRYHHILDPALGWPARGTRSVSVVAPDATTADALSTGLFVLGAERGAEIVDGLPGVGAVWVDAANQIRVAGILRGRLKVLHHPTDGL